MAQMDRLYPELNLHGSAQQWFRSLARPLSPVLVGEEDLEGISRAARNSGRRCFWLYLDQEERQMTIEGYQYGIHLVTLQASEMLPMAVFWHRWMVLQMPLSQLALEIPEVKLTAGAPEYEQGPEAYSKWRWEQYVAHPRLEREKRFARVLHLALQSPVLRRLFPFFSMWTLILSRTTSFEYVKEAAVEFQGERLDGTDLFLAVTRAGEIQGTAEQAVAFLEATLPEGITSVHGTYQNLLGPLES